MFNHLLPPSPPSAQVLAGRQRQIQEKIELNRRAQEQSIKYREQLIKELEEMKEGTRWEKEQQRPCRRELQAQVGWAPQYTAGCWGCPISPDFPWTGHGAQLERGGGTAAGMGPAAPWGAGAAGGWARLAQQGKVTPGSPQHTSSAWRVTVLSLIWSFSSELYSSLFSFLLILIY